jgi:MFS family permease
VLFFIFGGPLLVRFGPVRSLQGGAVLAAAGLLLATTGWWPLLALASLVMGVGYGPSPPAGSRILAATAPRRHRTLIFSIKQAGAPAGGALAGLILAPAAQWFGWPAALLVSVAAGLAAALLIAPLRETLDVERDGAQPIGPGAIFHWRTIRAPFVALRANLPLMTITALAVSFAVVQGCLFGFTVTYLSVDRGLSLAEAGSAYAAMQAAGVVARIILGWLADRTGAPALNLTIQAVLAAGAVLLFAALPHGAGLPMFAASCALCGFLAASWNGIYLAEVVRLAPHDQVVEATAGSSVFTFLGYMAGPSLFSALVTATGQWRTAFIAIAVQLALMAVLQALIVLRRSD